MGHRHDDALAALRAYARDLDSTATRDSLRGAGGSDQDGAPATKPSSSGAPHQMAIAAVAAGVVLIGSIGIAVGFGRGGDAPRSVEASPAVTSEAVQPRSIVAATPVAMAARAFAALGMQRTATAVDAAITTGLDDDPGFTAALDRVRTVVAFYAQADMAFNDLSGALGDAVTMLETASRPPGLQADRVPPGLGGIPPGQDPTFIPPGQDPTFIPPGQDPTFIPPGQDGDGPREPKPQDKPPADRDKGGDS